MKTTTVIGVCWVWSRYFQGCICWHQVFCSTHPLCWSWLCVSPIIVYIFCKCTVTLSLFHNASSSFSKLWVIIFISFSHWHSVLYKNLPMFSSSLILEQVIVLFYAILSAIFSHLLFKNFSLHLWVSTHFKSICLLVSISLHSHLKLEGYGVI